MSDDLVIQAVDAIAAAKCAEIEARRVLARLSPEDQWRLRHDFGFMGRAGTFTPPGTMTPREIREAVHFGETVANVKLDECLKHYDAFPSGKTRGQEVAEKYIRLNFEDVVCIRDTDPNGRGFIIPGNRAYTAVIRDCIASIVDEACAAAVNDERDRILRRTAPYATIGGFELAQILRP